jgi:hypothetical protein
MFLLLILYGSSNVQSQGSVLVILRIPPVLNREKYDQHRDCFVTPKSNTALTSWGTEHRDAPSLFWLKDVYF